MVQLKFIRSGRISAAMDAMAAPSISAPVGTGFFRDGTSPQVSGAARGLPVPDVAQPVSTHPERTFAFLMMQLREVRLTNPANQ